MSKIGSKIIRTLRRNKPSSLISEKLGFKTNVVYAWETNRRSPTWKQFIKYCEIVDKSFLHEFISYFQIKFPADASDELIKYLVGDTPYSDIAKSLKVPKSSISKFIHGRQEPSLDLILSLISLSGGQLNAFLAKFDKFKGQQEVQATLAAQDVFFQFPEAIVLWNLMDLEEYKSALDSEGWLVKSSGIVKGEMRKILARMEEIGIVQQRGSRWEHGPAAICLQGPQEQQNKILTFCLDKTKSAVSQSPRNSLQKMRYSVFTVDDLAAEEIRVAISDFLHRVGTIVEKSQSRPQTQILNLVTALTFLKD